MGLFSKKKSVTVPATGYYAMPEDYKNFYNSILSSAGDIYFPDGSLNTSIFTPLPETADETRAFEMMRAGFTPTQETLGADIDLLMNPFDEYVVDDLNRQAQGDYSLMRQYATSTGQFGSNRDMLGASDVEQNRLNSIGQFRQAQYNNALDQVFNGLVPLRQQDANNLLGIGGFQRELDWQTQQAPVNALNAAQGTLNAVPTSFGNFGTPQRTVTTKSPTALGSVVSAAAPVVGAAVGGPIGGAIGGAVGSAVTGGNAGDILQGGFSGYMSPGLSNGSLMDWGGNMGQFLGSVRSPSPMGPYQPPTASFFR